MMTAIPAVRFGGFVAFKVAPNKAQDVSQQMEAVLFPNGQKNGAQASYTHVSEHQTGDGMELHFFRFPQEKNASVKQALDNVEVTGWAAISTHLKAESQDDSNAFEAFKQRARLALFM